MNFRQHTLELLKKYRTELDEGFLQRAWKFHTGKAEYGRFESYLAYCLIRDRRPLNVFEVGCASGFSSYPLAFALSKSDYGLLYSFEMNQERGDEYRENMHKYGLLGTSAFIWYGDARTNIPSLLSKMGSKTQEKPIDVLFMDADHGKQFAEWYIKELVPKTKYLLHIHDIWYGSPQFPEAVEALEWLKENSKLEWFSSRDLATDYGMDTIDGEDPCGSRNSSIWVKLDG